MLDLAVFAGPVGFRYGMASGLTKKFAALSPDPIDIGVSALAERADLFPGPVQVPAMEELV